MGGGEELLRLHDALLSLQLREREDRPVEVTDVPSGQRREPFGGDDDVAAATASPTCVLWLSSFEAAASFLAPMVKPDTRLKAEPGAGFAATTNPVARFGVPAALDDITLLTLEVATG